MNKKSVSILSGAAGIFLAGAIYSEVLKFPAYAVHASQYVKFLLAVMAFLCALLIVASLCGGETGRPQWVKAPGAFTATVALTLVYVLSLKYIGFYAASAVYMLVLAFLLGLCRPLLLVVSTAALLALVYGVFVRFLGVPVPLGIFEEFTFADVPGSLAKAKAALALL